MSVFRRVFGLLRQIFGWLFALAERFAAAFSRAMDFALRPNTLSGRVPLSKLLPWAVLNLLAVAAVTLRMPAGHELPQRVVTAICGVGFLTSLLVVSSALLKLREDNDVVSGLVMENRRRFHMYAAVSDHVVVAWSIIFLVLFLAAAVQELDHGYPSVFSERMPHLTYGAYLLATLKALPVSGAVVALVSSLGEQEGIKLAMFGFGNLGGTIAEHAITVIGSVFLVGLVALWLKQIRDTDRLIDQYLRAGTVERGYLQQRVKLSPLLIKPRIVRAAVAPRAVGKQTLAIDAAVEFGILEFPREFCARFSDQRSTAIKTSGLNAALQILQTRGTEFSDALAISTLSAVVLPLERTRVRSERNILCGSLTLRLMERLSSLDAVSPETLSSLDAWMTKLFLRRQETGDDLVVPTLKAAMKHGFVGPIAAFASHVGEYPDDIANQGLRSIREKIARQYGPSPLSSQIIAPLKKALDSKLADEIRMQTEQLLQIAIAQNTPQPTLAQRALGWIPGLKPPAATPAAVPAAVNAKPASSHAA